MSLLGSGSEDWFLVDGETLSGEDEPLQGIPPKEETVERLSRYRHDVDSKGRAAIRTLPRQAGTLQKLGGLSVPQYVIEYWEARLLGKRLVDERETSKSDVSQTT